MKNGKSGLIGLKALPYPLQKQSLIKLDILWVLIQNQYLQ